MCAAIELTIEINTSPKKFSDLEKLRSNKNSKETEKQLDKVELVTANEHDAAQMLVRSLVNDVAAEQI